jgi:heme/copper-type cytochrome/quinol oxidase subunit 4
VGAYSAPIFSRICFFKINFSWREPSMNEIIALFALVIVVISIVGAKWI